MAPRVGTLLRVLSSTAFVSLGLTACGTGYTYGTAPGPPEPVLDAGPLPDAGPRDTGPEPEIDSGPPRDAGNGCVIETVVPTPADDLAAFTGEQLPAEFACASCHVTSGEPAGVDGDWGPSDDPDPGKRWHDGVLALLSRADQAGLAFTDTRLYAAFSFGITGVYANQHPNDDAARAALEAWNDARQPYEVETCTDAGPAPLDAGPQLNCTPTLPSQAESEARFNQLGIGAAISASNCNLCHVGGAKSPTGTSTPSLSSWGNTADDATSWHGAFYGKALQENADPLTTSVLYTHLNGVNGSHSVKATERDSTEQWLDYVLNGEVPVGCP